MKTTFKLSGLALATATLAMAAPMAQAADQGSGAYVAGSLAYNRSSSVGSGVDAALSSQAIGSSSSADRSSSNGSFRLGMYLNPNFAIEGSYDRIGKLAVQTAVSSPLADTAAGNWSSHGLGLYAVGIAPIDRQWSVYGRVGVESWHSKLDLGSTTGGATSAANSASNTSLGVGAGTSYAITPAVDVTGEFMHFNHVGDNSNTGSSAVNQLNIGLRYHFSS